MRRTFIILGIVLVIAVLGYAAYSFFFTSVTPSLVGESGNVFGNIGGTPVGGGVSTGGGGAGEGSGTGAEGASAGTEVAPKLVKITSGPVAYGVVIIDVTATSTLITASSTKTTQIPDEEVRYVERGSGNIYAYRSSTRALTRLTNKTIPGIQETTWLADGSLAYLRFISTDTDDSRHIETYALPVAGKAGYVLARDLADVKISGTATLLTLSSGTNGTTGTISKSDGSNAQTAFSSSLGRLFAFPTKKDIFVVTPASAKSPGYAFDVSGGGAFTRVAGPLRGLSIVPNHTGTKVLASYVDGSSLRLVVIDVATGDRTLLPVSTLAEKCVWTPDDESAYCGVPLSLPGTLPDDWYQGVLSFSDRLWRVDFTDRVATLVANLPALTDSPIDAVSLALDPAARILSFTNRADGSLWAYGL